jgi:AraC-like DNA-binding protein
MWISAANERDADGRIGGRDLVLQLSAGFAERCLAGFSDCAGLAGLLEASRAGIEFSAAASAEGATRMEALLAADGFERMALFFNLLTTLEEDRGRRSLSLKGADHECAQPKRLERILAFIAQNFNRPDLSCREVAQVEGMQQAAFSRLFERHIKCTCVEYINHLKIYKACQLLTETELNITTIGLEVGYDTLSTFNRNFRQLVGKTPSAFRADRRFADPASSKAVPPSDSRGEARRLAEMTARRRVADTPPASGSAGADLPTASSA